MKVTPAQRNILLDLAWPRLQEDPDLAPQEYPEQAQLIRAVADRTHLAGSQAKALLDELEADTLDHAALRLDDARDDGSHSDILYAMNVLKSLEALHRALIKEINNA